MFLARFSFLKNKESLIALSFGLILVFSFAACHGGKNNLAPGQTSSGNQVSSGASTPVVLATPTPTPVPYGIDPVTGKRLRNKEKVRALYLTGWTVGSDKNVQHFINLAKTTEINTYVVDIKDDDGRIGYKTTVQAELDVKGWEGKYDVKKVLDQFHQNGIRVIGRLASFKDPILSSKRPELAIKHSGGGIWRDNNGLTWLDPYNKESWDIIAQVAKEADDLGFDEIQFDYVRFANDGAKSAMAFNDNGMKKYEAICGFLAYIRSKLPDVILSADIFGIVCESPEDTEGIGQYLEFVGKDIDYISPMAYPSHYAVGQNINKIQYMKPDLEPYGVVYNTMLRAKERIALVPDYRASVRPYLQDFTATWLGKGYYQSYGTEQVKQQIKAVKDAGYDEWIFWDAASKYSEDAFEKKTATSTATTASSTTTKTN